MAICSAQYQRKKNQVLVVVVVPIKPDILTLGRSRDDPGASDVTFDPSLTSPTREAVDQQTSYHRINDSGLGVGDGLITRIERLCYDKVHFYILLFTTQLGPLPTLGNMGRSRYTLMRTRKDKT